MTKPIVYIASPYTKGDPAINTHFQCAVFDRLLKDGKVVPLAPLWSHFQHLLFPRSYGEWMEYDRELLRLCDCCLRIPAEVPDLAYAQHESAGADSEVELCLAIGKPVFYSIDALYLWVDDRGQ